ncbi:3-phosphoserine/phosphohydroxythreonine transaminase [Pseudogulbenkiania ferrooxidans]|uniref:Phosphoserine aminotransferase n=1 Tax=Pseudogulbenkiania ferrooxidans 2002 TaxID=279714 RepID=B9Z7Q0_9NEIS|nr:3-phosphoserine/phosphohydroxythreonine transaminase [Pseudogulbenkiania ferrooxidans]EEG07186.1 Phosphoserine transaminase [Pseudogulbenkiania ferrooxidans 2002]
MSPAYNFASGPARLPDAVLERAHDTLLLRGADGACALERPFSSPAFRATLERARQRLAALLDLPAGYRVLFLAGGAMQQFSMVPLNLLGPSRRAAYADSGYWAGRAIREARRFAEVAVVARYQGDTPLAAPPLENWRLPDDCAYCHITPNETGEGIAYPALPNTGAVPLVADATSCFLAAPLDISRFGLIYAGAQKNIGPAGLTVVIVREDLLQREARYAPAPYCYRQQLAENNTVNTPVGWAIELAALVFDWIAESGGLAAMAEANRRKAERLYHAIDTSGGFYRAPVAHGHRSPSNVRFQLTDERLTEPFLQQAEAAGLTHLRGHCHVGGLRASLYNAMPEAGVAALVAFMADFARRQG